jgi:UMF1 family MFS transporter
MEDGDAAGRRAPRYKGEDTSLSSEREIRGWYLYGVAAEVFAVCGVGSFLPVTLEQLAKENAVLWSDKTTSCMPKAPAGTGEPANATVTGLLARASESDNTQCVIRLFGSEITTSSFAMYTFSLAVFVQALALVSFSSFADHSEYLLPGALAGDADKPQVLIARNS